jgi:hypothetical protein
MSLSKKKKKLHHEAILKISVWQKKKQQPAHKQLVSYVQQALGG